jgi:hypothetical protein
MEHVSRDRRGQRGVALAIIAIALTMILGFCVLAVDLGHLGVSSNEVQIVVDGAAAAGARSLLRNKMTGGNESSATAGTTVAARNTVDGEPADGAPTQVVVTQGLFNMSTGVFSAGGASPNAVSAVATARVPNLLGGILGPTTTQVQRTAIAAYGGTCTAQTALPLALGSCLFSRYLRRQNCGRLPNLQDVPDPLNDSCWTSLGPNTANATEASAYLPSQCCTGRNCGGGQSAPRLQRGSQINGMSGQDDVLLRIIKDCYDQGIRQFVVPVINCSNNNNQAGNNGNGNGNGNNQGGTNACGQNRVVGFATIRVNSVKTSGTNKGMDIMAICNADDPGGAIGCTSYGRESVALVK